MRRDRDRRDNADEFGGDRDNNNNPAQSGEPAAPSEMQLRALWLLDEIIRMTPRNDVRLGYLTALREQIETDEAMMDEAKKVIAEFEEAYAKLTAPANSIGGIWRRCAARARQLHPTALSSGAALATSPTRV